MTTNKKGRHGGDRPTPKTSDSRNHTGASLYATFGTLYRTPTESELLAGLESLKRIGKACIQCGKPFNATRKVRGFIAYQNANMNGMVESRYPLCRRCTYLLRDNPEQANQGTANNAYQMARTILETGGEA